MFKRSLCVILSLSMLCLAGCFSVENLTFEELMEEVNAKHQAVEQVTLDDISKYEKDRKALEESVKNYGKKTDEEYNPEKILTKEEAIEDVEFLFDMLYDCYGPYESMGGAQVFDAREEEVKNELQAYENLTAAKLEEILLEQLNFIQDGHFNINKNLLCKTKMPFFFRKVAFWKTRNGYETTEGEVVESIEGYEDIDALMKRSVSPEGELVYYPVILKDGDYWEALKGPQTCDETLTIHYTNGKTQELEAEPYEMYVDPSLREPGGQMVASRKYGEIPVFQFNTFDNAYLKETLEGAVTLKKAPISILDLRSNMGGSVTIASQWINSYTADKVPGNMCCIDTWKGQKMSFIEDDWMEEDNRLIILTGKFTMSAAERLVDYAYNVENVLIVGENTYGACVGNGGRTVSLPNSLCQICMGSGGFIAFPQDEEYFQELRGFYPDIWVPAGEAEDLVLRFLEHYGVTEG